VCLLSFPLDVKRRGYHIQSCPDHSDASRDITIFSTFLSYFQIYGLFWTEGCSSFRPHFDEKNQSSSYSLGVGLYFIIQALGNDLRKASHCIGPVVKCTDGWVDDFRHGTDFEFLHIEFFVISSSFVHELSDGKLYIVVLGVALLFVGFGAPVEADLAHAAVEDDREVEFVCSEQVVQDEGCVAVVAYGVSIDREVSVRVHVGGVGLSLAYRESWRICEGEIHDMCGFEVFVSVEKGVGAKDLIPMHAADQQNWPVSEWIHNVRLAVLIVEVLALLWVAKFIAFGEVSNIVDPSGRDLLKPEAIVLVVAVDSWVFCQSDGH
jgi:hypothetical protein